MEEVRKKYVNMLKICNDIDASNEWIISMQSTSLELFLYTIQQKINSNPNCDVDSLYKDILEVSKITDESIANHRIIVKRYVEYFYKICKSIN